MLYQLSYEPQTAGVVGLEPTTFEVEARHSIQLSYAPVFLLICAIPYGIAALHALRVQVIRALRFLSY